MNEVGLKKSVENNVLNGRALCNDDFDRV